MWNVTFDALEDAGIEAKLANTFKMAIIAKTGKKTDKVDAEKIAQILRMNMIPECYVPSVVSTIKTGSQISQSFLIHRSK